MNFCGQMNQIILQELWDEVCTQRLKELGGQEVIVIDSQTLLPDSLGIKTLVTQTKRIPGDNVAQGRNSAKRRRIQVRCDLFCFEPAGEGVVEQGDGGETEVEEEVHVNKKTQNDLPTIDLSSDDLDSSVHTQDLIDMLS